MFTRLPLLRPAWFRLGLGSAGLGLNSSLHAEWKSSRELCHNSTWMSEVFYLGHFIAVHVAVSCGRAPWALLRWGFLLFQEFSTWYLSLKKARIWPQEFSGLNTQGSHGPWVKTPHLQLESWFPNRPDLQPAFLQSELVLQRSVELSILVQPLVWKSWGYLSF